MNGYLRMARAQGKVGRIDSGLEATFAQQLRVLKVPTWQRNYQFLADRALEIDFAWPHVKFGVEIQGGVHAIKRVSERDSEKAALAILAGWTLLPITTDHVHTGRGVDWTQEVLLFLLSADNASRVPPHRLTHGVTPAQSDNSYIEVAR